MFVPNPSQLLLRTFTAMLVDLTGCKATFCHCIINQHCTSLLSKLFDYSTAYLRIYEYSIFTLSAVAGSIASSRPYQGPHLMVVSQFIPILTGEGGMISCAQVNSLLLQGGWPSLKLCFTTCLLPPPNHIPPSSLYL